MSISNSFVLKSVHLLLKILLVLVALDVIAMVTSKEGIEGGREADMENNEVLPDDSFETFSEEEKMNLVQLDPVKVGFIRQMELEPGKFYDVETVAMKPPIFSIPNFLTTEECDRIKHHALKKGLRASATVYRRQFNESINKEVDPYFNNFTFIKFDEDKDKYLNVTEAAHALGIIKGMTSLPGDVFQYILMKFVDVDSNGYIDNLEFRGSQTWVTKIEEWIDKYKRNMTDPKDIARMKKGRPRISEQTFVDHYSYDQYGDIANRLITLTNIHPYILFTSEKLQVVHYTPGGHYHAHYDSSHVINEEPCDHTKHLYPKDPARHLRKRRQCRFITILYYLENTEEGGETAFPAADNETYYGRMYEKENRTIDPFDLKNHCHDANLVIKPKKGLAVMWYNHYIDPETEWLGKKDPFSLHGGCDVIKGEKWIANSWITVDNNYEKQMEFHETELDLGELEDLEGAEYLEDTEMMQDFNGNHLQEANKNIENGDKEEVKIISDQGNTDTHQDRIRNEL